jgi:hypothetical protein
VGGKYSRVHTQDQDDCEHMGGGEADQDDILDPIPSMYAGESFSTDLVTTQEDTTATAVSSRSDPGDVVSGRLAFELELRSSDNNSLV